MEKKSEQKQKNLDGNCKTNVFFQQTMQFSDQGRSTFFGHWANKSSKF
jgi:hypothetical protein